VGLVLLAVLLLSGCATLPAEVHREEAVYQIVDALDGLQSFKIAKNPQQWHEQNPMLGLHPGPAAVVGVVAVAGLTHFGITVLMQHYHAAPWIMRTWEALGIGYETGFVIHNKSIGITIW
jgi:starvation-inducible outer membrane lipoprotein